MKKLLDFSLWSGIWQRILCLILMLLFGSVISGTLNRTYAISYKRVLIQPSPQASFVEMNIAGLLSDRLREAGIEEVRLDKKTIPLSETGDLLLILIGIPATHNELNVWLKNLNIVLIVCPMNYPLMVFMT